VDFTKVSAALSKGGAEMFREASIVAGSFAAIKQEADRLIGDIKHNLFPQYDEMAAKYGKDMPGIQAWTKEITHHLQRVDEAAKVLAQPEREAEQAMGGNGHLPMHKSAAKVER